VFGDERIPGRIALQVTPSLPGYAMAAAADDLKEGSAWKALEVAKEAWQVRLPEDASVWLGWLIGLPQAELIELLTLGTALSVSAMATHGETRVADAIADAVGLDMADWWEPTAEGYLLHVSKAQIIQALKEAGTEAAANGIGDMKKDALVAKAVEQLAGKRWLPRSLRPRTVS
jgi:ParB family chromosome partitioning protein